MRFSRGQAGAIVALVLLGGAIGQGSSHREAPGITKTPKLDGTDFYMFRSYEAGRSGFVTLVANGALVDASFFTATFPYLKTPLGGSPNKTH